MKLTRFSLVIVIALIFAPESRAQDDTRTSATWSVQKYDVSATLPTAETDRSVAAKAGLSVKNISASPASTLSLRLNSNAEVSAVTVNGTIADFTKREERVGSGGSLQRISIRIPSAAPNATLAVTVDYTLTIKDNSGIASISPAGSIFLPLSFWYPTPNSWFFARGADHAPFQIRVIAPQGATVVSAGNESAGGFDQKLSGQPFFVSGNWDVFSGSGASVYFPKGLGPDAKTRAGELVALAGEIRAFVAAALGAVPDVPLRIVASRRGAGFSQAGTILVDEGLFRSQKLDSQTAMSLTEAIVKIHIGNAVNVIGDGQGALREGLPRFLATEFVENKWGKDVADVERLRQRTAYYAVSRRDSALSSVSPVDDYYFGAVANKGSMIWRLLEKKTGRTEFFGHVQAAMRDGSLDLPEIRAAFVAHKPLLDQLFDQITDTNLLVGVPQQAAGESKVALRNSGSTDATVSVEAQTSTGEKLRTDTTIRAGSFGEVIFRTPLKLTRVEVDTEKLYPQIEYADDVAPKELGDSDMLLAVKRAFDKQDFSGAEAAARIVLRRYPRFDDARVLLGRSLLALGRSADAEREFRAVLDEKLPSARSIAWSSVGLGEVAFKAGQNTQALRFAEAAILGDAEYGASFAARVLRNKLNLATPVDDEIKTYFARFDKAAVSNRKAEVDALVISGDVNRFAGGISGSTEQWATQLMRTDRLDANTMLAEANLNIKLLNREPESGMAVFRLVKVASGWKLAAVEMFEVR